MKLYWSSRSPFARKVMVAAHETGQAQLIACVPVVVSPFAASTVFTADNPLARIPTLITNDGVALYDSAVICEYLDDLNTRARLFPTDAATRIRVLTLQALGDGLMDMLVFWTSIRARFDGPNVDALASASRLKLANVLDALERRVDELGGEHLHIGALAVGVGLGYLDFRYAAEEWRAGRPRLAAWHTTFEQRDSAQQTRHCD